MFVSSTFVSQPGLFGIDLHAPHALQRQRRRSFGNRHSTPSAALSSLEHAFTSKPKVRAVQPRLVTGGASWNARQFSRLTFGRGLAGSRHSTRGSRLCSHALLSSWAWKANNDSSSSRSPADEKGAAGDGFLFGRRNRPKDIEVEEEDDEGSFSRNLSDVEKVFALSVAGILAFVVGQFILRVIWGALGLVLLVLQYIAVAAVIILAIIFFV